MIVESVDVDHLSLVFVVYEAPFDNVTTKNGPYAPLEFNLKSSQYYLNITKAIPAS